MKVLLVAHAWPDEALGGVELHVRTLARELVRRRHQVIAVVGSLARAPVSPGARARSRAHAPRQFAPSRCAWTGRGGSLERICADARVRA